MKLIDFIKGEFKGFSLYEKLFFVFVILFITSISIYVQDSKIALLSSVAGISYTILAGKGKVICYFIGMIGTICYCILSYKNSFFGNLALYGLYYFPMEIIGVFKWLKHYDIEKREIKKTKLNIKERVVYFFSFSLISIAFCLFLNLSGGKHPYIDGITTIFSILGQFLTVKRCIEQWYIWLFVNILSFSMWLSAFLNGGRCLATVLMWLVYIILSFYFWFRWKKEITFA